MKMHIAGRLSIQSPSAMALLHCQRDDAEARIAPNPEILSFHGCDVIVRQIDETGFQADLAATLIEGALVRLRLPGAGVLIARVRESAYGRLVAEFVNPVSAHRLGKTLGLGNLAQQVA